LCLYISLKRDHVTVIAIIYSTIKRHRLKTSLYFVVVPWVVD
jgi:hypothetical protein